MRISVPALISSFRPKTLTAALVPCLAATFLAYYEFKTIFPSLLMMAILSSIAIQIATNLINDAEDFERGADREDRIGPKRVTVSGLLTVKQVRLLAYLFFVLAIMAGIPLVYYGGWPIVAVGVFSILAGYAYTAGPYPLAYHGWGDFFVLLFFGIVATNGMYYLHTGQLSFASLWLSLQIGLLATVLIAINNLRDRFTDEKAGKRTLAVKLGARFVKYEISFLILAPFIMNLYWFQRQHYLPTFLVSLLMPLVIWLVYRLKSLKHETQLNKYLSLSALIHLLFGVFISIGWWVSA